MPPLLWNGGSTIFVTQIHQCDYIPKEIEDKLLGQNCLFKLQMIHNLEIPMRYPFKVIKVCNLPEIVDKYVPESLDSQPVSPGLKLSDMLFGSELVEVFTLIIVFYLI